MSFLFSYIGYILAGATFGRVKNWSAGEVLTHTDLNAEFNNILNQLDPDGIGVQGLSSSVAEMYATADPYPGGSASVPTSLEGDIQRLRYVVAQMSGKTYWYQDPINTTILSTGDVSRPIFTWTDANTISIGAGAYHHSGTAIQMVYWVSAITFQAGADGSNAASAGTQADLGDAGWQYLYIDDSAVVTQASALLDADCFLNSTTAPTFSTTKFGWYNGNDRCIMAMYCDGTGYEEWWHDGDDYVVHADNHATITNQLVQASWVDAEAGLHGPAFSTRFEVIFQIAESGTPEAGGLYWRRNGSAATTGQRVYTNVTDDDWYGPTIQVLTDSSQLIELLYVATDNTINGWTKGWYFPRGM